MIWLKERDTAGRWGAPEVLFQYVAAHTIAVVIFVITIIVGWAMDWTVGGLRWDVWSHWLHSENLAQALIKYGWPLLLWAALWGIVLGIAEAKSVFYDPYETTSQRLSAKLYIAILAGIWEELGYRNLFIFTSMISVWIGAKLTFGLWLWMYKYVSIPVTDLLTAGLMHQIWYGQPLLIAAGMVSTASAFAKAHQEKGLGALISFISSFYFGCYMLFVMLTQGLIVAMVLHALYDAVLWTVEHFVHDALC